MKHYRIKFSTENGTYDRIKSTVWTYEDAEAWAEDTDHARGCIAYREGVEPPPPVQVWEFEEITGIGAAILNIFRG